jgi:hypothetical protein
MIQDKTDHNRQETRLARKDSTFSFKDRRQDQPLQGQNRDSRDHSNYHTKQGRPIKVITEYRADISNS